MHEGVLLGYDVALRIDASSLRIMDLTILRFGLGQAWPNQSHAVVRFITEICDVGVDTITVTKITTGLPKQRIVFSEHAAMFCRWNTFRCYRP